MRSFRSTCAADHRTAAAELTDDASLGPRLPRPRRPVVANMPLSRGGRRPHHRIRQGRARCGRCWWRAARPRARSSRAGAGSRRSDVDASTEPQCDSISISRWTSARAGGRGCRCSGPGRSRWPPGRRFHAGDRGRAVRGAHIDPRRGCRHVDAARSHRHRDAYLARHLDAELAALRLWRRRGISTSRSRPSRSRGRRARFVEQSFRGFGGAGACRLVGRQLDVRDGPRRLCASCRSSCGCAAAAGGQRTVTVSSRTARSLHGMPESVHAGSP